MALPLDTVWHNYSTVLVHHVLVTQLSSRKWSVDVHCDPIKRSLMTRRGMSAAGGTFCPDDWTQLLQNSINSLTIDGQLNLCNILFSFFSFFM